MDEILLKKIDAYFRAANYLSACQLYLLDNPLLKRPLKLSDIKPKIVGHWGTVPGQNFIYVHLNRLIKDNNLDMIYISGPGHGGNSLIANTYLEGTYSKYYPEITQDQAGLKKLFKQFSFPGGVSSHVAPEVPGSINEGGELGYSLSHAFGAVLDNPNLIAACVVGDGEAETGPLATSWRLNKFLRPNKDGIVFPILHLNGYKIANPTVLARISHEELESYFTGLGYHPIFVEGKDPLKMHEKMYDALNEALKEINFIKEYSKKVDYANIHYPMIILRTPKGWTCPSEFEGKKIEDTFRAHQVPITIGDNKENVKILEKWLKSYKPEELFDESGHLKKGLKDLIPDKNHRMGDSKYANGGLLLKELKLPKYEKYEVKVKKPGAATAEDMRVLGNYVRDVLKLNNDNKNFRVFGPDEALSNRLNEVFNYESRTWEANLNKDDEFLSKDGRVMDGFLSEHFCQGALEGYLLTGRHGFFHTYEAFVRIVDSMASQHAKWLKVTKDISWRKDIASLNYILTSHVWQQDHNGYTHQDPGFLNHLVTKKADIIRAYLPPDANTLLSTFDHCLKTKNYINVIVASKHERPVWLSMADAKIHCAKGISKWAFASNDKDNNPDIVLACCGDTPTLEVMAAVSILRTHLQNIKIRVINVIDLMRLQSNFMHPHGLTDKEYDALFTYDKPIVFVFHGYPNLIHELTYNRHNQNMHVRGYNEEGTITTPFDMRVQNNIDRYHIVMDTLKYLNRNDLESQNLYEYCQNKLTKHHIMTQEYGKDIEEVANFNWNEEVKKFIS